MTQKGFLEADLRFSPEKERLCQKWMLVEVINFANMIPKHKTHFFVINWKWFVVALGVMYTNKTCT